MMLEPEVYAEIIDGLGLLARDVIPKFGGVIAQIYGDGLLSAFQGAGSCERALAAGFELHERASSIALPAAAQIDRLALHSGIHAGLVLIKSGDAKRGSISMYGRVVGVAARLAAAAGRGEILVSASALGTQEGSLHLGDPRAVEVSGATDRVIAVPVLGLTRADLPIGRRLPFVGRMEMRASMVRQLLAPGRSCPITIAITGTPGQGKTRLSEEIAQSMLAHGVRVLRGAAAHEATTTLQAFRSIAAAATLALGEALAPEENAEMLAAQVIEQVKRLSSERPLLLVLDDWQWADTASLQMLDRLQGIPLALGILLLTRERTRSVPPITADHVLDLEPLTDVDSAALVRKARPELDLIDAGRIHRLAGGNPLYLEELCQLSARALSGLAADPGGGEIGRIASLVEARVREQPPSLRQVLECAAVIGDECPRHLIDQMCEAAVVPAILDQLRSRDFLIPSHRSGDVRFKHGITRNVVYQLISPNTRRALHGAVARLIEVDDAMGVAEREEVLAWHYAAGAEHAKAAVAAERAGDRATAAGLIDRALLQYRRAIDALDQIGADDSYDDRIRLVGKYGFACVYDADRRQLDVFARMADIAARRGDRHGEAVAMFWSGYVCHGSGQARRAVTDLRAAARLAQSTSTTPFSTQVHATLGQALVGAGYYDEATPLLDQAISLKLSHRSGRNISTGTAYALALKGAMLGDTGRFAEADEAIAEALTMLIGRPHPVEGSILGWAAAVRCWQGDWQGLYEVADRGCKVALRIETIYIHAISRAFRSYARWKLDGSDSAAGDLIDAVACMTDRGKELALSIACGCLADVEAARGDDAACRSATRRAYARARAGEPFGKPWAARALARLTAPGDPMRARRLIGQARASATRRGALPELARCDFEQAALGLVATDDGIALAAKAANAFRRMGMASDLRSAEAFLVAAEVRPSRSRATENSLIR